jgi:gliding motility-associated-like protein
MPTFQLGTQTAPTQCAQLDGSIEFTNMQAETSYDIKYSLDGAAAITIAIVTDASGNYTLSSLGAGSYSGISISHESCVSVERTADLVIGLVSISIESQTHPTSCLGLEGTIVLSDLVPNLSYELNYLLDGTAVGPMSFTAGDAGRFTVTGLGSGVYTEIQVASGTCQSNNNLSTTLVNPLQPIFETGQLTDPSLCSLTDGAIQLSSLKVNTTYDLDYDLNGSPAITKSIASDADGNYRLTDLGAGEYSGITLTLNGCTSIPRKVILANPQDVLTLNTSTHPLTCGGADGSLLLSDLLPNTTYDLDFEKGGAAAPTISISSDADGNYLLVGLSAGIYTNIHVTHGVCGSVSVSTTLLEPDSPFITLGILDDVTSCATSNGSVQLAGLASATDFTLNYKIDGVSVTSVAFQSDASGNYQLKELGAGVYTGLNVTTSNCASNDLNFTINEAQLPIFQLGNLTAPTQCFRNDGSIEFTDMRAATSYDISYSLDGAAAITVAIVTDANGNYTLSSLGAGLYSGISVSLESCISVERAADLVMGLVSISIESQTDPTTCQGVEGTLVLTGLVANLSYELYYVLDGTAVGPISITAGDGGGFTLTGLGSGVYTEIHVTSGTCQSINVSSTLNEPSNPTIALLNTSDPTNCDGLDGSFELSDLIPNTSYQLSYKKNGIVNDPFVIASDGIGEVVVAGLGMGVYSEVHVIKGGCQSPNVSATLVDPASPTMAFSDLSHPTTCEGINGSIELTGLLATTEYTISYTGAKSVSTKATSNDTGTIVVNGLSSQPYTDISVSYLNCASNVILGPVTLTDPAPPEIALGGSTKPQNCLGEDGQIVLTGLLDDTSYGLSYIKDGELIESTVNSNAEGSIEINELNNGAYYDFEVLIIGCWSNLIESEIAFVCEEELYNTPVVTPNGDGLNDYMLIEGIEDFPDNVVKIFNRWGNLIWEIQGYTNDNRGFGGLSNSGLGSSGAKLTDGTYFIVIDRGDGSSLQKDFVMIKR